MTWLVNGGLTLTSESEKKQKVKLINFSHGINANPDKKSFTFTTSNGNLL